MYVFAIAESRRQANDIPTSDQMIRSIDLVWSEHTENSEHFLRAEVTPIFAKGSLCLMEFEKPKLDRIFGTKMTPTLY